MAKIIKMSIDLTITPVDTPQGLRHKLKHAYPVQMSDLRKMDIVCTETAGDAATVIARADNKAYCVAVVADADLDYFLTIPGIELIDDPTAISLGTALIPEVDQLVEPDTVMAIIAKVVASGQTAAQALTVEELAAITPGDSTPGINRSGSFTNILSNSKIKVG